MTRVLRTGFIVWIVFRYGLDELVLRSISRPWVKGLAALLSIGRSLNAPRGVRLREALERLGPIFVKFGQVLSTRRDLLPPDIADELARLQDRVPPIAGIDARAVIEKQLGKPVSELFASFSDEDFASASIAHVHRATFHSVEDGVIKL